MEISKKRFSLIDATTRQMLKGKEVVLPGPEHYYPSESSVIVHSTNGTTTKEGACMRKAYLRILGEVKPSKMEIYLAWAAALGKATEQILVEQWKVAGWLVGNNMKFYNKQYNVSGELDAVLRDPGTGELFGVECKTWWGYYASREILGNKSTPGYPKIAHLLQTLVYLKETQNVLTHMRLFYVARDSGDRREFIVESHTDDQGVSWPVVDGVVNYGFSINDIYDRFTQLDKHVKEKNLPEPDYDMVYSSEKVNEMFALGKVSDSAFKKWQKSPQKNPIGHYMCKYCPYDKYCYNPDGTRKN